MAKTSNAAKPLSSICLIRLWLSTMNRSETLTTREVEKDVSDPPQNRGFMRPFVAVCCGIPLLGPMGSLTSSFIPAGRLGTAPHKLVFPGGGRGAGLLVGRGELFSSLRPRWFQTC